MPRNKKRVPVANVPTGLPYGKNQQLQQQRQALPPAAPTVRPVQPDPNAAVAAMSRLPVLPPLGAPTERPGEPVTAGLAIGPGAGPEALAGQFRSQNSFAEMLELLASETGDADFARWAQTARTSRNG